MFRAETSTKPLALEAYPPKLLGQCTRMQCAACQINESLCLRTVHANRGSSILVATLLRISDLWEICRAATPPQRLPTSIALRRRSSRRRAV